MALSFLTCHVMDPLAYKQPSIVPYILSYVDALLTCCLHPTLCPCSPSPLLGLQHPHAGLFPQAESLLALLDQSPHAGTPPTPREHLLTLLGL